VDAIALHGVSRRFGDFTAVDEVSFTVADGEIVGLLGHNGAGKTTLIRVINGLLPANEGQVRVRGLDPVADGAEVRRSTGVLTEYPALDEFLTTRENLEVYAAINSLDPTVAGVRIEELLHRLGLWEKRDEPARELSAGLKQRVALARGMVHDPTLLLLDEPTTNMDPVAAKGVRDLIIESVRERGRTVLLSTHNLAEAEDLCDRVAILRDGRLLTIGSPSELRGQVGGHHGVRISTTPGEVTTIASALGAATDVRIVDDTTAEIVGGVSIPVTVKQLVAAGVAIRRVEPLEPTLEDLYVALHAESGAA
jgi:ABC-2 type transport system ATP-binding protein